MPERAAPLTLLIDANNLVCRLYYALKSEMLRQNAKALAQANPAYFNYMKEHFDEAQTVRLRQSVQYSLYINLQQLIARYQPHYVMAAVDSVENFRKERHETYKKGRPEKSALLQELIQDIPQAMRRLGILPVGAYKHEADDVLATLAARAPGKVIILTQDHDLYTLLSPQVYILGKSGLVDEQTFIKTYGILPPQLPFYKALLGDSSDSMAGLKYFRQNRDVAAYIVTHFSSPAALFANLNSLPSPAARSLKTLGQDGLEQSIWIHTLCTQAPVTEL